MNQYTEQDIVTGCKNGDRQTQEYVYKAYYGRFLKVCARYAKDMHDAEQLLNDGFLKIFSRVGDFKNKGSFEGWMNKVMVNVCLDYLKSSYMKSSMKMQVNTAFVEGSVISVSNDALNKLEFKELVQMIQKLPVITRTVFNLYVFEQNNHKQIALMLDMSEGTSHWHLHQARKQLQEMIKKNDSLKLLYEDKGI